MLKLAVLMLTVVLISGCASTFKPSEKMLLLRQGMDKQTAVAVIAKYSKPAPGQSGYCGGNKFTFDPGTPLAVTAEGYTLQAYKKGDLISKEQIGSTTRYLYKKIYYEDGRKFADLSKIRVIMGVGPYVNCTKPGKNEVTISLHYSAADIDGIIIAKDNLDEMMAALVTLAPQAKLIEGVGL